MRNHESDDYVCPFCLVVRGIENEHVYTRQGDIVYCDGEVTAFVASHWYPKNPGHVIIVPDAHIENLYNMPDALIARVHALSKRVAVAMREIYGCAGITIRQNNEPVGNQNVWHYHVHVYPRYEGDGLFTEGNALSEEDVRKAYAEKLRAFTFVG